MIKKHLSHATAARVEQLVDDTRAVRGEDVTERDIALTLRGNLTAKELVEVLADWSENRLVAVQSSDYKDDGPGFAR